MISLYEANIVAGNTIMNRRWDRARFPVQWCEFRTWQAAMVNRITVDSRIHFGKPCVAGTRIPVHNVLELVREGIPFADIIRNYYPDLEIDDIRACVRVREFLPNCT